MSTHTIGIIGLGKIAQDQHLPVIRANPDFQLLAVSSQRGLSHGDAKYT
jgi:D-galactose 1-dehydrogenase